MNYLTVYRYLTLIYDLKINFINYTNVFQSIVIRFLIIKENK